MLNPDLLRRDPEKTRAALARRGDDAVAAFDAALQADTRWRELTARVEQARASRNLRSGASRGKPTEEEITQARQLRQALTETEGELQEATAERTRLLSNVPNPPDPSVPEGKDETDNVVARTWGEPRTFSFPPLPHWELGEKLGIIDMEAGARLAGARFYVLRGAGAALERALINFMLDLHTREQGYTEIEVPYMVREEIMYGSGQLPKFYDNLYHDAEENLWMIPTAEVPLVNLDHGRILEPGLLPQKITAQSACFRREKVAAGKDIRGIKRLKQFFKVEMVRVVEPEESMRHLGELVDDAEEVFRRLELPYQVMLLCTGDLGVAMAKTFDLNVWAPGCGEWLECSSCSNANDYQARRTGLRFRREAGSPTEYPHTLNGSGVGLPRTVIAVMENYQEADGSLTVPRALRPYMGGLERITGP